MMTELPRLSGKEMVVLRLLASHGSAMYGLQLVGASNGELGRGSVYVVLDRMERKGLVDSRKEEQPLDGAAARRLYWPTGLGERALAAWEMAHAQFAAGGAA